MKNKKPLHEKHAEKEISNKTPDARMTRSEQHEALTSSEPEGSGTKEDPILQTPEKEKPNSCRTSKRTSKCQRINIAWPSKGPQSSGKTPHLI